MIFTNQERALATAVKYALKPKGSFFYGQEYWIKKAVHIASKKNIVANKVPVGDILQCVHGGHIELAAHLYSKGEVKERVENLVTNLLQVAQKENQDNPQLQKLHTETVEVAYQTFETLSIFLVTKGVNENALANHGAGDLIKLLLSNASSEFKADDTEMNKKLEGIVQIIEKGPSVNGNVELFKIFNSIVPVRDLRELVSMPDMPQPNLGKFDIDVKFENGKPSVMASLKINESTKLGKALAQLGKSTGGMHGGTDDLRVSSPVDVAFGVEKDGALSVETIIDLPGSSAVAAAVKAIGQAVEGPHSA